MPHNATPIRVLIIEDDSVLGGAMAQRLRLEGFSVSWAETCEDALEVLHREPQHFILADIRLPDGSGEDMYRKAMPFLGKTPIVFATAFADIEQAVRLVRAGANDYLTKPYDVDALVERIRDIVNPADQAPAQGSSPATFGLTEATESLAKDLRRLAKTDLPILLRGETGTGKEVAARYFHHHAHSSTAPFVAVNCGAIPRELSESQFFGHERGAFTGASSQHTGFFEEAANGTLFLDEIGELDFSLQTTLLRVLQERTFRKIGGRRELKFQGRIVAATNADLEAALRAGRFRDDLYFRLAVVELNVPPLRRRTDEIIPLAQHFADAAASRFAEHSTIEFTQAAVDALLAYQWPGNVRELRNRIERAVALADHPVIDALDLFSEQRLDTPSPQSLGDARQRAELQLIEQVLTESGGRIGEAAKRLGISRTTLWKRLKSPDANR